MPATPSNDLMLPQDTTVLPIAEGGLLVSRDHACYCRVPTADLPALARVLAGETPASALPPQLLFALSEHGFFAAPRPHPLSLPTVQLQLTNRCMLACRYCSTNAGPPLPGELPKRWWFRLVRDIHSTAMPWAYALLGGEAFMAPWAMDLAEEIADAGQDLTVFSNGLPLADKPKLARRMARLIERGAHLAISLPGAGQTVCDRISGGARFAGALAALRAIGEHLPSGDDTKGSLEVHLLFCPDNVADFAAHLPDLRDHLPRQATLVYGLLGHRGRERGRELFASRTEVEAALDRIAFTAGEAIPAPQPRPTCERREGCGCVLGVHVNVRADGLVFSCYKMEEPTGDLRKERFAVVVERLRQLARPARKLPFCKDCALATLCGAGCRAENLVLTGDGDLPACGPWRVRVLCELLAEDRPDALDWPASHLLVEARARGIAGPDALVPVLTSRSLLRTPRAPGPRVRHTS